uniref:Uncharacterized protein n=1 Tax=Rhizophora mucronata TaxID=61149 RepID=A0A2P2NA07_RHIMU
MHNASLYVSCIAPVPLGCITFYMQNDTVPQTSKSREDSVKKTFKANSINKMKKEVRK